ncbi:MAG: hypothetical protein A3C07_00990 [Candidatus Sungbacteria bacterium RIFCSPHIGHO2_02_FULL_47_11]|uniref:Uncharacterized protein n=1 Tax=Candidatus Sungbacteria bacterium RIFCSPHIGHO2_02_FULL_47_11 TaxID=1802270 RepID=A0A1G2KP24_9BACT|nr:MAG: hypothetical protein A3C07_00990 [Candidatus Sungbacteria bacterium RIFCSPHIGHO2_02_FULL_47_11]
MNDTIQKARKAIRKKMFGYIAAGLGLIAGLAWNDAIRTLIDYFIPDTGNTIVAKMLYALFVTIIVGLILFYIEKSLDDDD